jgi:hypothetical protein
MGDCKILRQEQLVQDVFYLSMGKPDLPLRQSTEPMFRWG